MTSSVLCTANGTVATVTLNRPDNHNAFDSGLIRELDDVLAELEASKPRVMILTGSGSTFSAGADLNWMRSMALAGEHENFNDAMALARCLRRLDTLPFPTVARINGSAYGGGVGLASCCDIAITVESAKFCLSEVKLGLVPAVISPYVIAAIGARQARRYFLSAEVFGADTAKSIGLVHDCAAAGELDDRVARIVHWLGKGGPSAMAEAKRLIHEHSPARTELQMENQDTANARLIAVLRASQEGQEGLGAFLEKRPAAWIKPE